jgi:hypothetical protein
MGGSVMADKAPEVIPVTQYLDELKAALGIRVTELPPSSWMAVALAAADHGWVC